MAAAAGAGRPFRCDQQDRGGLRLDPQPERPGGLAHSCSDCVDPSVTVGALGPITPAG
jgi:hypothetical protein